MTLFAPVCTCAVPGILGCAKHTYGADTIPEPPLHCTRCGRRYWSWGAHAEECPGVVPEDLPCDCNPGFHEPECVHAGGKEHA
jgi:hypothetical protein